MSAYLLKRLFAIIPTVLGITLITFLIIQLAPGNPAEFKIRMAGRGELDAQFTAQIIEQTKKLYGLDRPLPVRYWIWLKQIATFNFGNSYKDHRPVRDKILERVPVSLQLSFLSIFLVYLLSVPLGVFSAVKQKSLADRLLTLVLFVLYSLPNFWTAMLLIAVVGGGVFDWFPIYGLSSEGAERLPFFSWLLDRIHHLVLPVACLTYEGLAYISRQMRGAMLEVIRQDYIRTARAKGLSEKWVIFKHGFRNSLIPIITLLAVLFPAMIGGSVIIESIFSIPGMGQLSFEAILSRDYPVIMGVTTVAAFLTLFGILAADLAYTLVDPRITFESAPLTWNPLRFLIGLAAVAVFICAALLFPEFGPGLGTFLVLYGPKLGTIILAMIVGLCVYLLAGERTYWAGVLRQFRRDTVASVSLYAVFTLFLLAVLAPLLANDRPLVMRYQGAYYFPAFRDYLPERMRNYPRFAGQDFREITASLSPPDFAVLPPVPWNPYQYDVEHFLESPNARHLLGTDDTGRDVLSRIIHGSRIALSVGFVAVGIYIWIGVILGSLAGYYGGWVDMVISRLIEVMLSIPTFFLIIAAVAFLEPSIYNIMAAIGLVGWTGTARLVRGEFLKLRNIQFVEATRSLGASDFRTIFRHILPNAMTPVLVVATFGVADAILIESALSFLGFGVMPPTPSWGDILSKSKSYYNFAWWLMFFPGFAIFFTMTALNLVGEGFRDAVDPRLKDASRK